MKRIFPIHLFCLSGVALVLGACTSEVTDGGNTPADGPVPISFQTPETRAAKDGFGAGDAFSVWGWYADDAGTNSRQVFNAEEVTNVGGNSWSYDGTQYWIAGKTYDFYAVYPTDVNAQVSQDGTITIDDFDASQTGADALDLMTASATGMKGDSPQMVGLRFGHLLSRLSFTVTSEGDAVIVTSAALVGAGYKGSYIGGVWNLLQTSTEQSPFVSTNVSLTTDALSATFFGGDLLLMPDADLTDVTLKLKYQYANDTEEHEAILSLHTFQTEKWAAGCRYNYAVTIPQNGVDVTLTVTVKDWEQSDHSVQW